MKSIEASDAPKPIGPYAQAVRAGHFVFLSGQISIDPRSGKIGLYGGDVAQQTERVLENLRAVLAAAGLAPQQVVKTTIFLTDLSSFAPFNEVYGKFFGAHKPARSTVQVAALPKGAAIEIEAIAYAGT